LKTRQPAVAGFFSVSQAYSKKDGDRGQAPKL